MFPSRRLVFGHKRISRFRAPMRELVQSSSKGTVNIRTAMPTPTVPTSEWREFVARCICPVCLESIGMSRYLMDPDRMSFVHSRCLGLREEDRGMT